MKNLFKKISALVLAAIMVLTMCSTVSVFANTEMSKNHATIKGIENETGITVKAYKIVDYNEAGVYNAVINGIPTNPSAPTVDEVYTLSKVYLDQLSESLTLNSTDENGNYIIDEFDGLTAGTWMIIVSGSQKYLYNPAILSVSQTDQGIRYGTLDYDSDTWDSTVVVKKAEPKITKTAEYPDGSKDIKGVQFGDILKFTVTSDVPGYENNISNIKYKISDTLTGLTIVKDNDHPVNVNIEGEVADLIKSKINNGESSFEIKIDDKAKDIRGSKIIITYFAKVTSTKLINVDKTNNTASLDYSTNDKVQHKEATTKHYTFGIDTGFNGEVTDQHKDKTGEFIKIDNNGNVSYEEKDGNPVYVKSESPLSGAKFQLHIGSKDGKLYTQGADENGNYTTDADGRLQINGLDSDVTYYLIETKAPTGYSLVSDPIKVKIDATYDNDGNLTAYSVTFDDEKVDGNKAATHYSYTESTGKTTLKNEAGKPNNPFGFKNTKLSALPSTGGMGTYLFTIVGVVLMTCAAGAFFVSRRKTNK